MAPALAATDVTMVYGERTALAGVTVAVEPGEVMALIGPNGAGKTTLLQLLAGVLAPSQGRVEHAGGVGWVPQQPALYRRLSVAENLRLFARLEGVADPQAAVGAMLDLTGLGDRAGDEVGRLSGGNQQRVNIAIGLIARPSALLLDEPSAALDPVQRERLWQLVEKLAHEHGTAVLYSTHMLEEAARHAGRLLLLDEGRAVFTGTPDEFARRGGGGDLEASFERAVGA